MTDGADISFVSKNDFEKEWKWYVYLLSKSFSLDVWE